MRRRSRFTRTRQFTLGVALMLVVFSPLVGCDAQAAAKLPAAITEAELPPVATDTPQAVVSTLLRTIRADLRARADRDRDAIKAASAQLIACADVDAITASLGKQPQLKAALGDDVVAGFVRHWSAIVAYYAGGIDLESIRIEPDKKDETRTTAFVDVHGDDDDATLQITLQRTGEDPDAWRVRRVTFADPRKLVDAESAVAAEAIEAIPQPPAAMEAEAAEPDPTSDN